ncbi:hypothetical protein [Saccharothrix deserti]|uniref:hypothetical protein n=1 Tax=Saccharothrix deserti TaxID=2593674 RepID=UPI001EE3A5F6|nr:hypothetical protein [Saccharothrix deserti]
MGRLTEAYVAGHHYTYDYTSPASAACPTGTRANAGLNTNRVRLLDQTAAGTAETRYCYDAADRLLATEGATALSDVTYDESGNTTGWASADGSTTKLRWDGSDRNIRVQTTGPNTAQNANVEYTRDASNRIVRRDPRDCDNNTVTRYGFTGDGDAPDLTLNADGRLTSLSLSLSLSLPGGVLYTTKVGSDGAFTPSFEHLSVRGDLVLTTDAAGRQAGELRTFDPYGQPLKTDGTVDPHNVPDNTLDALPPRKPLEHLRSVLVAAGALPHRDEQMSRLERWITQAVSERPDPAQQQLLRSYGIWHLLRRLRRRVEGTETTHNQLATARQHLRGAMVFLDWLASHDLTLATCGQPDFDRWLTDDKATHRDEAGHFVRWAKKQKLTRLTYSAVRWGGPVRVIDTETRWEQARRLLNDRSVKPEDRVAGLLILLYAQWPSGHQSPHPGTRRTPRQRSTAAARP